MPVFTPNRPIETREPLIKVEPDNLPPGRYRFRLVVVDDDGNASAPDEVTVTITRRRVDGPRDPRRG